MTKKNLKENLIQKAYEFAYKYEKERHNCPQCVLAAIQEVFDLEDNSAFKSATGLGSWGSYPDWWKVCGALIGGVMSLGLKYGRGREEFDLAHEKKVLFVSKLARELYKKFEDEYASCDCRDIQKKIFGKSFNLWDPEEYDDFEKAGGHKDKCPEVAGKAAAWVAEIILRQ
jgi:C_GCAxxG_C_C family probable redox protein